MADRVAEAPAAKLRQETPKTSAPNPLYAEAMEDWDHAKGVPCSNHACFLAYAHRGPCAVLGQTGDRVLARLRAIRRVVRYIWETC